MSLCSGIKMSTDDCLDENPDGFRDNTSCMFQVENTMEYVMERSETLSDDIVDLLPADPFGMDFITTFTAVSELLEDIDNELAFLGFICDDVEMEAEENFLYRELNLVWNDPGQFPPDGREWEINGISMEHVGLGLGLGIGLCDGDPVMSDNMGEAMCFGYEKYWDTGDNAKDECEGCSINCAGDNYFEDCPNDVLLITLGYLGVRDLLNIQGVSKFFRDTVRNNSHLWKSIHIDWPLNSRLTDDNLLQLTSRAQGDLQCLRLVECTRITIDGLKSVLDSNPRLTKLSIPGCVRINIESILCCLKSFKPSGFPGIKKLRIGDLHIVTQDQFHELNLLLDIDHQNQVTFQKPRFYGAGKLYLPCTDDRLLDIEICPMCQRIRQVYDCPAESCQGSSAQLCKACCFCIARCIHCGNCISDSSYEETFCLDLLCLNCLKKILKCQEEMGVSSNCSIFHQEGSLHFCLFG